MRKDVKFICDTNIKSIFYHQQTHQVLVIYIKSIHESVGFTYTFLYGDTYCFLSFIIKFH